MHTTDAALDRKGPHCPQVTGSARTGCLLRQVERATSFLGQGRAPDRAESTVEAGMCSHRGYLRRLPRGGGGWAGHSKAGESLTEEDGDRGKGVWGEQVPAARQKWRRKTGN